MIIYLITFIFGAAIGSFLNVCIYRIPLKLSIISPSSFCPLCNNPIPFYYNIPILSYIILLGRCHGCKGRISVRYPLVELVSAILTTLLIIRFGFSIDYFIYLILSSSLIIIIFIDIEHGIVPDIISIPGIVIGFMASFKSNTITYMDSLIGIIIGGGSLFIVAIIFYTLTKREGIGGGDIKLLSMIGAFLGWKSIFIIIFIGSLTGTLISIPLMIIGRKSGKDAIPFAPFLSLGAFLYLFVGDIFYKNIL